MILFCFVNLDTDLLSRYKPSKMGLEWWKTKTDTKGQGDEIVSKILTKSNIEEWVSECSPVSIYSWWKLKYVQNAAAAAVCASLLQLVDKVLLEICPKEPLLPPDSPSLRHSITAACCVMFLLTSPVSCNYYYHPAPGTARGGDRGPPTLSSSTIIEP